MPHSYKQNNKKEQRKKNRGVKEQVLYISIKIKIRFRCSHAGLDFIHK